jgi:HNH endonuclease
MIKKDPNVKYHRVGLFNPGYKFFVVKGRKRYFNHESIEESKFQVLMREQEESPVRILHEKEKGWTWWMFGGEFYWTNEDWESLEIRALILEASHKKAQRVHRAMSVVDNENAAQPDSNREPVPDEVKILVWQRDRGKCVKCGSQENLEYDHIIPLSRGGSNTARNIQILCESCNRSKGTSIV